MFPETYNDYEFKMEFRLFLSVNNAIMQYHGIHEKPNGNIKNSKLLL